jgi:transcription initiation factor IIE alpha subunit
VKDEIDGMDMVMFFLRKQKRFSVKKERRKENRREIKATTTTGQDIYGMYKNKLSKTINVEPMLV